MPAAAITSLAWLLSFCTSASVEAEHRVLAALRELGRLQWAPIRPQHRIASGWDPDQHAVSLGTK